jgi:menaquinone-dependent protoporphyrinogen IX oxidase
MARVLVAYGTKNGSTAEIAQAIVEELRGHQHEADCVDAGTVGDVARCRRRCVWPSRRLRGSEASRPR